MVRDERERVERSGQTGRENKIQRQDHGGWKMMSFDILYKDEGGEKVL